MVYGMDKFTWDDREGVAEASELGFPPGSWPDSFWVRDTEGTGWCFLRRGSDGHGGFVYTPSTDSTFNRRIVVFND